MKFKSLASLAVAIATTFFIVSCDDDINTIGQGIQPGTDNIQMEIDSVFITAETVKLDEDVYLRTNGALLGSLEDPIMGKTKSEFLAEFFCANSEFKLGYDGKAQVDSVFFSMSYYNQSVVGDTLSPMAVNVYELNLGKNLRNNFYTNVDPAEYSDKKVVLGQRYFKHADLDKFYNTSTKQELGKHLYVELDKSYGQNLYEEWKKRKDETGFDLLKNSANLKTYLKGIYVTSDMNNKMLLGIYDSNKQIQVVICYSYKLKKVHDPKVDSVVVRTLPLQLGGGALQLNSIVDTSPTIDQTAEPKAYVKSPVGYVTKLKIPLAEIRKKAEEKVGKNYMINSSIFKLAGMTELEKDLMIQNRPQKLLFIHKDSLNQFFLENRKIADPSIAMVSRNQKKDSYGNVLEGSNNTYRFNVQNTTNESDNLSRLINFYIEREKEMIKNKKKEKESDELEFYLIPVDTKTTSTSNGQQIEEVLNSIAPTAAIFRTDRKNMRMSLMFSKYNEVKK